MRHFQRIFVAALCSLSFVSVAVGQEAKPKKKFGVSFDRNLKVLADGRSGMVIIKVSEHSSFKSQCPARKAGLKVGDVIVAINEKGFKDFKTGISMLRGDDSS